MRRSVACGIATSLAICGSVAHAEVPREALKQLSPETQDWQQVAPGLYEAENLGGTTRAYLGDGGRLLYISKLKDDIRRASPRLLSDDAHVASKAADWIASLENEIETLEREATTSQKVTQHSSDGVIACQLAYNLDSWFTSYLAFAFEPVAKAQSSYGGQLGPVAPPPFTYYRSVRSEVFNGTYTDTDFRSTTTAQGTIAVSSSYITGTNGCLMETDHVTNVTCWGGAIQDFSALNRQQTCAGVTGGTPPTETWQ